MGKKRKADETGLDEADRNLYANFRAAANSLSLLYSHTVHSQRLSFHSGQLHALETLYQWILRHQEERSQITTNDIVAYLQAEIERDRDDAVAPFPTPSNDSHSQTVCLPSGLDSPISCNIAPSARASDRVDQQAKTLAVPNSLTCPVHLSLQGYHLTDDSRHFNNLLSPDSKPSSNEPHNQGQRHSSHKPHVSDDCTDMQTDDSIQKSAYRFFKHE